MGEAPEEELNFEGNFSTWEEVRSQCTGYDAPEVLAKVLEATLRVKHGAVAYERDSVVFDRIEYAWPVLSGLMWAAARNSGKLNVLDFGGSLGTTYFQNRKFLQALPQIRWNVVEQAHYVEAGRAYIQDEQLHFYRTIAECLSENQPNVILLSGVLAYLKDPYGLLKGLLALQADIMILDRMTYLHRSEVELVNIQYVPESIYKASYPCRSFVENKLCNYIVSQGYRKIEDFESVDKTDDLLAYIKGHIFKRETLV